MELPEDFSELLRLLNSRNVEYLIIGGYALAYHGVPRFTGDLDIFLAANPENADALLACLDDFGFGALNLNQEDFVAPGNVIQIGYPPLRVDFLTEISGVTWKEAWIERIQTEMGGVTVNLLSRNHLIRNKRAAGRPVDLGDLDRLR